jgi:hypothetical protein
VHDDSEKSCAAIRNRPDLHVKIIGSPNQPIALSVLRLPRLATSKESHTAARDTEIRRTAGCLN